MSHHIVLCDCSEAEKQLEILHKAIGVVAELAKQEIQQRVNREIVNTGDGFQQKYEETAKRIKELELSVKDKQIVGLR